MPRFSANLGFLWTELPLPDAIHRAAQAGFAAVEFHWPYATPADEIRDALAESGLFAIGINTDRGGSDMFGLSALPDRTDEARAAIDQAFSYGAAIDARFVHVMAGLSQGDEARRAFVDNLHYACDVAMRHAMQVLIEPINMHDVPGYFLSDFDQAAAIIADMDRPELKLMFDCYHAGRMGLDVGAALMQHLPVIGHIQFANVPDRGPPNTSDSASVASVVNYPMLFGLIDGLGWEMPLGAEYKVDGDTDRSLTWLEALQLG